MYATLYHTPVLEKESLAHLLTSPDGLYVDCTLGGGGHAQAILEHLRGGRLIGFDRDEEAIRVSRDRLRVFGEAFTALHAPFGHIRDSLTDLGIGAVQGILLDLGVSSHHLDEASRGFSFQEEGPLDMRMDRRTARSAADVVNTYNEQDLASVLVNYGEEREAVRIARAVTARRPLTTTAQLAEVVRSVVRQPHATKALARVFQALRIEVNGELQELHAVLGAVPVTLAPGGRIVVLTYHSLEDRIVKEFFRATSMERDPSVSRFLPERPLAPVLKVLTRKPVRASDDEAAKNPRARSAKLRAAERI